MRRYDEPSNDLGPLLPRQSCPAYIIDTRGYDSREGQVHMTQLDNIRLPSCSCGACGPLSAPSRRQFLCTTAAGSLAASIAPSLIGAVPAQAQQAPAAGRPILLRGGCVLSLDRAVGDFEQADVLIEGNKISA